MNNESKKFRKDLNLIKIVSVGKINKEKAHYLNMTIVEALCVAILLPIFVSAVYAGSLLGVVCALILTSSEAFTLKKNIVTLAQLHQLSKKVNNLVDTGFELQDALDEKLKKIEKSESETDVNKTEKNLSTINNSDKIKKYFNEKENMKTKEKDNENESTYVVIN